jgi:Domain of unknown function (DUF4352)
MSSNQKPHQPYNNDQSYQYQQQSGQPLQGYQMPPGYQQPIYQQPVPPQPKKKAKWPWVVGGCGCLTILAIIGMVIITGGIFTATKGVVASGGATSSSSSSSASASTIAKVGQTITVNQVSCTLVSVQMLSADQYNTPKAGDQFIVAHIVLKNGSGTQVSYNPLDFHIKSAAGNVIDTDFSSPSSYTANNTLDSGNLDPNGSISGDIIMQAPIGDKKAELTWTASIFANNTQYGWVLGTYW